MPARSRLEDVRAVMGDEAEARAEEVCDAAGEGDFKRLDLALSRLWAEDTSPIAVLRVAMGHFQRVALAKAQVDARRARRWRHAQGCGRRSISRAPISFKMQVSRWSEERLADALDLLLETEALCKTTGMPAEAVCGRALFNIASMARMRG